MLTVKQASLHLGVSPKTVYKLFKKGELRGHRVGRAVRIKEESVRGYIAAHSNAPEEPEESVLPVTCRAGRTRRNSEADFTRFYREEMERDFR